MIEFNKDISKQDHEKYWDRDADFSFQDAYVNARQNVYNLLKTKVHGDIVEVGAGSCLLYPQIRDRIRSYTMVDFTYKFVDQSKQKYPEIRAYHARATELPFMDKQFDVSVAMALFRHMLPEDMVRAIRELVRVGRKTIIVWSITPQKQEPYVKKNEGFVDVIHNIDEVAEAIGKTYTWSKVDRFTVYDI